MKCAYPSLGATSVLAVSAVLAAGAVHAAAPDVADDILLVAEDDSATVDWLLLNDEDADGDPLSITGVGSVSHGTLVDNGGGSYTYTADPGYVGSDSFTYDVTDGTSTVTGTVLVSVNAALDAEATRDALLAGVSELANPTQPGHLGLWGPTTLSVSNYAGQDESRPMIAAATLGAGRVVVLPDHQWLNMDNYGGTADTGAFYQNALNWAAGTTDKTIAVVTVNSSAATWLAAQGYTNVTTSSTANLPTALASADLFTGWLGNGAGASVTSAVEDFLSGGGAALVCDYSPGYSWWWGKDKWDIPGSIALRKAGIAFVGNDYVGSGPYTINRADDEIPLETIVDVLENPGSHSQNEKDLAVAVMQRLVDALHEDDSALARMESAFDGAVSGITPSEASPVTDGFERSLLEIECALLAKLEPADMTAHRAALPVDAGAPRLTNATYGLESPPTGHSTRTIYTPFYAPPGELVTVSVPSALASLNLDVRVSHLRNGDGKNSFPVMPDQMINFDLNATQIEVANPHGGLIQVIVPGSVTWTGTEDITVTGAVEAPFFKLGTTTDAAWTGGIRDRGTPFGVLDSPEATLVIDADLWLRDLDDPEAVISEWDFFCGKVREFYDYDAGRQLPVHHDYYPAGGVSTYPQSYGRTSNLVDSLNLKSSAYALTLHEYGHICDSGNIIFHEFGETSPNMGGKWLQETARKYAWKQELTAGRINNYLFSQTDDLWNHFNHYKVDVKGTPFDLLSAEFGPAVLKDSVAAISAMSGLSASQDKIDEWARQLSNRTGFDMSYFFAAWQIPVSAAADTELSAFTPWMPVERVPDSLIVTQDTVVTFNDPSVNDFSYDGTLTLVGVSQPASGSVVDNADGTFTYTPSAGFTGADDFTYTVANGTGNSFVSTIPVRVLAPGGGPQLAAFDGVADGSSWTTVDLPSTYVSPVVVAQPLVGSGAPPLVPRIRNAGATSFEVRLDRVDGSATPVGPTAVRFLVVDEGVYDEATDGFKMEAVTFTSTTTDTAGNFAGEIRSFAYTGYDHYFIPTVFGQVMSANDANWSAFWYDNTANSVTVGKHVGEDPNAVRADETIGYIVMESGSYQVGDYQIQVGLSNFDAHPGFTSISSTPIAASFPGFPLITSAQVSSGPGDDGSLAHQLAAAGHDSCACFVTEDTLGDAEQGAAGQSFSYLLASYTGSDPVPAPDTATALENGQVLIDVLANDHYAGVPSLQVAQPANGGVVVHSDGSLIYTPDPGFTGTDAFTYSVDGVNSVVSLDVIAPATAQAGIRADRFDGISGGNVSNLTADPDFPDNPDASAVWTSLDSGSGVGDSYGHRIHGVVVPPTTGDYTFWIASDDASELRIGSDHTATGASLAASVSGWTGYQAWDSNASQESPALPLEAGKAYYLEVLHKEGGGGDHVAVAWEGPGFSRTVLATPSIFTAGDTAPVVASAPSDLVVDEGSAPTVIDVSSIFSDGDPGDGVSVAVHANSDPSLVDADLVGSTLTLSYPGIETGSAVITLRATDRIGALVTTSFNVTVNDSNPDSDADGLTDAWEVANFGSIAAQDGAGDPDADGLDNSGELAAGTDPNAEDSDGDGYRDGFEAVAGSDPAASGSQPQGLYAGLHSWWRFDESAGAEAEDTAGGNTGMVGGAVFTAGKEGNALGFDGVDDGVLIDSAAALTGTTDFSLTAWVKIDAASGTGTVIQQREPGGSGYQGEYMLNVNDNGTVSFFVYNSGYQFNLTTTATVNDDAWHHLTALRNGTGGSIYIDGVEQAQGSGTVKGLLPLAVSIGYDHRDSNKRFDGLIDDVRVYSRALSLTEVQAFSNQAPVVGAAVFSIDENGAAGSVGTVGATDPDVGDLLSFAITAGNSSGLFSIDPGSGEISSTGPLDHESAAQHVLTVEVTDDGAPALSDTATVTVNVGDVNEAPTATGDSGVVNEDATFGTVVAAAAASDPDAGDSVTFAITGGNTGGAFSIDPNSGVVTTAAALDFESTPSYVLTVTAMDGGGLDDDVDITITVGDVNESPTAEDGGGVVAENSATGTSVATATASDPDAGDSVTFTIIGGNTGGAFAIDSNSGEITTAQILDFEAAAAYSLTVSATDGGGLDDEAIITVSVTDMNEAPTADDAVLAADERGGAVVLGAVSASDPDAGDSLSFVITSGNGSGLFAIDTGTGVVSTTGSLDYEETVQHVLTVEVTDGGMAALSDTATVTVNVGDVAELPVVHWLLDDGSGTTAADASGNGSDGTLAGGASWTPAGRIGGAIALDGIDGRADRPLTESTWGDFAVALWVKSATSGQSIYASPFSNHHPNTGDTFQIDLGNGYQYRGSQTTSFGAAPVGEWVHLVVSCDGADTRLFYNGVLVQTLAGVSDDLFDTITAGTNRNIDSPFNGEIDDLRVYDEGLTEADVAALFASFPPPNQPPVADDGSLAIDEDAVIGTPVGTVSASDPDAGDALAFEITGGNTGGAFAIDSNGEITVATALDYETLAAYSLTVTVTDSGLLSDTATISIDVNDILETTPPAIATGAASNVDDASADLAFDVTDTGGENPAVTLFYGTADGGTTAGAWDASQSLGVGGAGAGVALLSGLDGGTTYYYSFRAVNVAGEGWGSSGSFTTTPDDSPKLVRTTVGSVSSTGWTGVDLGQAYNSVVVIATPVHATGLPPVVTRLRNVGDGGFEVMIERTDGQSGAVSCDVSIVAVEEGIYTQAEHGVTMEAVRFTSTVTASKGSWAAEQRTYQNSYSNPVVVGQVMSSNDADWSVFWCQGNSRTSPPSASDLYIGKTVCEDPDDTRLDETVGYIVVESGSGTLEGTALTAGLSPDSVRGLGNSSSGYNVSISGIASASGAAVSLAGMDGGDGGWAMLMAPSPISASHLQVVAMEDQLGDGEQNHTTEQVGFLVFE